MKISFIIPFKSDQGQRERLFKWISKYYLHHFPTSEICTGTCTTFPFSKAEAVNHAARKAKNDIFVIMDADILINPKIIMKSINSLNKYAWIIPYTKVMDLDKKSTFSLINHDPSSFLFKEMKPASSRKSNGGIYIMNRKTFQSVRGFDERFIGWGGEDDAFYAAVCCMEGNPLRMDEEVYHLWHPPSQADQNPYYQKNYTLATRYFKAINNKNKMKEILKESDYFKQKKSK